MFLITYALYKIIYSSFCIGLLSARTLSKNCHRNLVYRLIDFHRTLLCMLVTFLQLSSDAFKSTKKIACTRTVTSPISDLIPRCDILQPQPSIANCIHATQSSMNRSTIWRKAPAFLPGIYPCRAQWHLISRRNFTCSSFLRREHDPRIKALDREISDDYAIIREKYG
jgi:hypothetical protein